MSLLGLFRGVAELFMCWIDPLVMGFLVFSSGRQTRHERIFYGTIGTGDKQ